MNKSSWFSGLDVCLSTQISRVRSPLQPRFFLKSTPRVSLSRGRERERGGREGERWGEKCKERQADREKILLMQLFFPPFSGLFFFHFSGLFYLPFSVFNVCLISFTLCSTTSDQCESKLEKLVNQNTPKRDLAPAEVTSDASERDGEWGTAPSLPVACTSPILSSPPNFEDISEDENADSTVMPPNRASVAFGRIIAALEAVPCNDDVTGAPSTPMGLDLTGMAGTNVRVRAPAGPPPSGLPLGPTPRPWVPLGPPSGMCYPYLIAVPLFPFYCSLSVVLQYPYMYAIL